MPPLINACPSGRTIMPLQNMSQFTENRVMVPATGSSRTAPEPFAGQKGRPDGQPLWLAGQFPDPVTTKILLLCRSAAWIGLMGIV